MKLKFQDNGDLLTTVLPGNCNHYLWYNMVYGLELALFLFSAGPETLSRFGARVPPARCRLLH